MPPGLVHDPGAPPFGCGDGADSVGGCGEADVDGADGVGGVGGEGGHGVGVGWLVLAGVWVSFGCDGGGKYESESQLMEGGKRWTSRPYFNQVKLKDPKKKNLT